MKILFLGTGTSVGVPMIGCECPVCRSCDPRNRRRRTSLYVQAAGQHIVIDTPPDFREQALTFSVPRVDAVLFTHAHADHVFGFDDIRRFNTLQDSVIPAYGSEGTIANLKRVFSYVGTERISGFYRPRIEWVVFDGAFSIGEVSIMPLAVEHAPEGAYGFLVAAEGRRVAYVPDCHAMDDKVVSALEGVDVMILDGLRHRPHATHLTVADSVDLLQRIGGAQSYITHICHDLDHEETQRSLPTGVSVPWDGLEVTL